MGKLPYQPAIDGLRAIAVLGVVAYHTRTPFAGFGYLGVDVFFVISGYLITSILLREQEAGGIRLGAFYLRRIRRLYPALCAVVFALLVVRWITLGDAVASLTYVGNYVYLPPELAQLWSLAVEEQFYLLWPLAIPFIARSKRPAVWLFALYAALTLWSAWSQIHWPWKHGLRTDVRATGLVFGALLAVLPTRSMLPLAVLGVGSLFAQFAESHRVFAEAATGCVILLSRQVTIPFLSRPALVYVGRISYGMYLYHWPLWIAANYIDGGYWPLRILLTFALTIATASLSFHTIERVFRARAAPDSRTVDSAPVPADGPEASSIGTMRGFVTLGSCPAMLDEPGNAADSGRPL